MELKEHITEFRNYEPLMRNRFIVKFPIEYGIKEWHISKVTAVSYRNSKWDEIEITFKDPAFDSLINILNLFKENTDITPLFTFNIEILDAKNIIVKKWEISVGSVLSVDFGEFDYSNDSLIEAKLLIQPLSCNLISE